MFDVIWKGSLTDENIMMLDVAAEREKFQHKVSSNLRFFRRSNNFSDGLTKYMSQALIRKVITAVSTYAPTRPMSY